VLPRYWKCSISAITGLNYCDEYCGCGENAQLWYFPTPGGGSAEDWVPGWMNGVDSYEIWAWLVENGRARSTR
jgi:hypothetical protein